MFKYSFCLYRSCFSRAPGAGWIAALLLSALLLACGTAPVQEMSEARQAIAAARAAGARDYALAESARPFLGSLGFILIAVAALLSTSSAITPSSGEK